jgi:pimeloyl-ACP methyl ester carboxylesterase
MPYFLNEDLSLYYNEKGTGRLLLILPGNTASSSCHDGELDYFGQYYHTVSFDFRGTGKSQRLLSWPDEWWDKCADDAAALISHLGEQQCIVMGTSGGANIALLLAIKYPEHVSEVIADSCAELFSPEILRKEVSNRGLRTKEQIEFWKYANGDDWEDVVNADNKLLMNFADQGGNLFNGRLNTIRCPVLFTGSLKDSFIPDIGEQNIGMAKQIQNSTTFLSNDGDHPFMWTCPDAFRSVSYQFLNRFE